MIATNEIKLLPFRVGALMYVPALNIGVGKKLCNGAFPYLDSLAFCLEDAVTADGVKESEVQLVKTLSYIAEHEHEKLPLLFVRVRDCSQFRKLPALLGETIKLLTGVIFPKFDLSNAADYCSSVGMINSGRNTPLHFMPILENNNVMSLDSRHRTLLGLRELLDGYREYVINVRVGAMDFCSLYGLRRSNSQTIYDIAVVRSVLTDILTVFADEYVVSAPVFEYFGSSESDKDWAIGLENELRLDSANGFIGKTIIHPSQLPFIRKSLQPTRVDFEDASAILDWSGGAWGVAKSSGGNRMNEVATHCKWAAKVITLAEIYGVKEL